MIKWFLFVFLILLSISNSGYAQKSLMLDDVFIDDAQIAIQQAYNREYVASVRSMQEWREEHTENPIWILWPVFEHWWPIIADLTDTRNDEVFVRVIRNSISYAETIGPNDDYYVDALIVRAISHAFWGRLQSNRGQWLRSFRNARRAMSILQDITEIAPDHPDIPFADGMTLYFAAFLLDEYPAARAFSFMLPKGDRAKGLVIVEQVANEGIFFRVESIYFLGHIYLHYERQAATAMSFLENLYTEHPQNSYYARLLARTYFRQNQFFKASEIIERALEEAEGRRGLEYAALREEMLYMRGRIAAHDNNLAQAIHYFELSRQESKGLFDTGKRRVELMSAYYQALLHIDRGEIENARRLLRWVSQSGADSPFVRSSRQRLESL